MTAERVIDDYPSAVCPLGWAGSQRPPPPHRKTFRHLVGRDGAPTMTTYRPGYTVDALKFFIQLPLRHAPAASPHRMQPVVGMGTS